MTDSPSDPGRRPPAAVRQELRSEVGYGCPVQGCASPYLEYHHFDPPWATEHHHRPSGMVALCAEHHAKAGAGTFTPEQVRDFKTNSYALEAEVRGRFDWRRRKVIYRAGGNFYLDCPVILAYGDQPLIWQREAPDGTLLLSVLMLTASGEPRAQLLDHDWTLKGHPSWFECPPHGRLIDVRYPDGDRLTVEFWEAATPEDISSHFTRDHEGFRVPGEVTFPVTIASISMDVGGTNARLTPDATSWGA